MRGRSIIAGLLTLALMIFGFITVITQENLNKLPGLESVLDSGNLAVPIFEASSASSLSENICVSPWAANTGSQDLAANAGEINQSLGAFSISSNSNLLYGQPTVSDTALDPEKNPIRPLVSITDLNRVELENTTVAGEADFTLLFAGQNTVPQILTAQVESQPAHLSGIQTIEAAGGDLRGLATTNCAIAGTQLAFTGFSTMPGNSAILLITNPGNRVASAFLSVLSPSGLVRSTQASHLVLEPRQSIQVPIESIAPGEESVAVILNVEASVLNASMQVHQMDGLSPKGIDFIPAQTALSIGAVFPGLRIDGDNQIAVNVANPSRVLDANLNLLVLSTSGEVVWESNNQVIFADQGLSFNTDGLPSGTYTLKIESDQPIWSSARSTIAAAELDALTASVPSDFAAHQSSEPRRNAVFAAIGRGIDAEVNLYSPEDTAVVLLASAQNGELSQPREVKIGAGETVTLKISELIAEPAALIISPQDTAGVYASVLGFKNGDDQMPMISFIPLTSSANSQQANNLRLLP